MAFRHSDKERAEEHHKGPTKGPDKSVVTPYSVTDEVCESDQDGDVESANDNEGGAGGAGNSRAARPPCPHPIRQTKGG